ncbi:isopentenyl-diphosphate Delta-isomerase [Pontibacter sp. G13]|uniref:isopentenyl-diphosphate Delta-isomerase n=1 Tax=Pontibacter sp. G13 TaxID=3074898 RepID=UPI00288B7224|nr:isopentenyl-diphosphate Delta-isomerase [Pontibacter sp. G13]WNJ18638.1 isopentenyl-diphosphate Delta-isomerase [Pontibacter sp. G13]
MATNQVLLVNEKDEPQGFMEKMEAHEKGLLHRAFSIFVFDSDKKLLLQRRALEKYHSPGLWTNTCCSHPTDDKTLISEAKTRLVEEMGFVCELEPVFSFIYHCDFGTGLIEHELDHVIIGHWEGVPAPNPEEVVEYKWMTRAEIDAAIQADPEAFTFWFRDVWDRVAERVYANV